MKKALVVLSGGQDSTTCLAWAIDHFDEVRTITFDYGQRHNIEIQQAKKIAEAFDVPFKLVTLNGIKQVATSTLLTEDDDINSPHSVNEALPSSFVPGRNLIFLTYAAAYAYAYEIGDIVTGVCQTDYSGYPDCRQNTISALQVAINLGMDTEFRIHAPLMYLTKKESIDLMASLGHLDKLALSQTCYNGQRPPCNACPACELRAKGFEDAGIVDPLQEIGQ